jgi:endoglucanase
LNKRRKNLKERVLSLLLTATLAFSLTACGETGASEVVSETSETAQEETSGEVAQTENSEAAVEAGAEEKSEPEVEPVPITGENMISNGDFSEGTDPWYTFC